MKATNDLVAKLNSISDELSKADTDLQSANSILSTIDGISQADKDAKYAEITEVVNARNELVSNVNIIADKAKELSTWLGQQTNDNILELENSVETTLGIESGTKFTTSLSDTDKSLLELLQSKITSDTAQLADKLNNIYAKINALSGENGSLAVRWNDAYYKGTLNLDSYFTGGDHYIIPATALAPIKNISEDSDITIEYNLSTIPAGVTFSYKTTGSQTTDGTSTSEGAYTNGAILIYPSTKALVNGLTLTYVHVSTPYKAVYTDTLITDPVNGIENDTSVKTDKESTETTINGTSH